MSVYVKGDTGVLGDGDDKAEWVERDVRVREGVRRREGRDLILMIDSRLACLRTGILVLEENERGIDILNGRGTDVGVVV